VRKRPEPRRTACCSKSDPRARAARLASYWLAADAGGIGVVLVEGVPVCGIGSAGRFSQPASPANAVTSTNTGIATLRIVMI
jgi:hypothetical protein